MRRFLLWSVPAGLGAGAVAWIYGVQGVRPAIIAVGVVAVAFAFRSFDTGVYRSWPDRGKSVVGGGTSAVSRLAGRVDRHTDPSRGPDPGLAHLLRGLAGARLSRRGLSLSDPAADDVLGPGVREALLSDGVPDHATVAVVAAAIARLDRIDRPHPDEGAPA